VNDEDKRDEIMAELLKNLDPVEQKVGKRGREGGREGGRVADTGLLLAYTRHTIMFVSSHNLFIFDINRK